MSLKTKAIQLVINGRDRTGKAFKGVIRGLGRLKRSVFSLKTAMTGFLIGGAGGLLAKSFLNAARETENYQVRLKALLGSQKEGNRLFKQMADYAARVPFEYREVMASATQLSGVMRGGVDEITQWMPLIADLAVVSGLGLETTTQQVVRMISAGAGSADLFRERGISAMLGFQGGVTYTAEQTRKQLWEQWNKTGSQFKNATDDMAKTWDGLMSMLSDAWFQFRQMVMDSGVFDGMKRAVQGVLDKIKQLKKEGKLEDLAKGFGDKIMAGMRAILGALPGIISGAIKAAETLVLAVSGFKQLKGLFGVLLQQAQIWTLELLNEMRKWLIQFLSGLGRIPGVDTSTDVESVYSDIGSTLGKIDAKGGLADQLEQAKIKLGQLQIKQDETTQKFEGMAATAASEIKNLLQPAIEGLLSAQSGMADGHKKVADASSEATQKEVDNINTLIAKYNELNSVKLSGGGSFSTVDSLAAALEDEADK